MSEETKPSDAVRKFLSVAAAAEVLGLSEMTLYRVIQANSFPAVKVGRRLFIPSQALDDMATAAIASGGVVVPEVSAEIDAVAARHHARAVRLSLTGLTTSDVEELIRQTNPEAAHAQLAPALVARTGGTPSSSPSSCGC